jgi:hypothetical protein
MQRFVPAITVAFLFAAAPAFAQQSPRTVNLTPDSAPGWIPSEELEHLALKAAQDYLQARDQENYASSYALLTPNMKRHESAPEHESSGRAFNAEAGPLLSREIVKLTWTKDPANAPAPGVYAAIDVSAKYANIDRQCGYVIAYQRPEGGPFLVMRTESTMLSNAAAAEMAANGQNVDELWRQVSRVCPNYTPKKTG